jgi:hypothetical protein
MCVCVYVCMYVCMHVCMYVDVDTCFKIRLEVLGYPCMYVLCIMYVCISMHVEHDHSLFACLSNMSTWCLHGQVN